MLSVTSGRIETFMKWNNIIASQKRISQNASQIKFMKCISHIKILYLTNIGN